MKINLAWLYAITKYGYPPSIANMYKVIDDASRLGFEALELEVYKGDNLVEVEKNKLMEYIEGKGITINNVAAILPELLSPDSTVREKGLEFFKRACELAVYFKAPMIQTDTFTPPVEYIGLKPYSATIKFAEKYRVKIPSVFSWDSFWKRLVNIMDKCAKTANDYGLIFTLEPRVGETISNSDAMIRIIEQIGQENFGAVLDTGHLNAAKELIPLSVEKLNKKIMYIHVSDNDGRDNFHYAPGKGNIDWDAVFEGLKKYKFNGYIAIDIGGPDLKARLDSEVLEAKRFIEEKYRKYLI